MASWATPSERTQGAERCGKEILPAASAPPWAAFLSTGKGNRGLSAKDRPVWGTAVDKTSSLQVDGGWNVEHQVTSGLGHARQDPAFGLFFSRQAGPFDLISNLACEQFAHASPASAIPAGIRQPDADAQA